MRFNLYKSFYLALAVLSLTFGCKKEYESVEEMDAKVVEAYIKQSGIDFQKDANGTYSNIIKSGTGAEISYSERIPLVYSIRSLDGAYVNTDTIVNHYGGSGQFFGYFTPASLATTIKEVLKKKEGEIKVIVPSRLAYGRQGNGAIPGNASLEYTVKVLEQSSLPSYDEASIQKYMQTNNLSGFTRSSEGIYYKISDTGTGSPVTADSVVTVQYTGKLLNGKVFDKTGTNSATFTLSETIESWKRIVPLIKGGGTIRILTPSVFGYGMNGDRDIYGNSIIPPFSCLDFEIKVTDVNQP